MMCISSRLEPLTNQKQMLKTYTIDVHSYPQEFIVTAGSPEEAKEIACRRFAEATNGASVYETIITNEELL